MPTVQAKKRRKHLKSSHGENAGRPGRKQHAWEHVTPKMLEEWRTKTGLSNKEAADRLGVSLSCYYNWLREQNVPTPARQMELLRIVQATLPPPEKSCSGKALMSDRETSTVAPSSLATHVATVFQSYVAAQPSALSPAEVPGFLREIRTALTT